MVARHNFRPQSGPLQGQYFATETDYQNALARSRGFPSYGVERRLTGIGQPITKSLINRLASQGVSRSHARAQVREWFRTQSFKGSSAPPHDKNRSVAQGRRKHAAITWLIDNGYATKGDDLVDDTPY
jgi:hypothetical protein